MSTYPKGILDPGLLVDIAEVNSVHAHQPLLLSRYCTLFIGSPVLNKSSNGVMACLTSIVPLFGVPLPQTDLRISVRV